MLAPSWPLPTHGESAASVSSQVGQSAEQKSGS